MKVLHVYRTYFPATQGGLEEVIRQITVNTRSHGIESRVLAPARSPDPVVTTVDGVEVFRPRQNAEIASCSISIAAFEMFRDLTEWADLVHYHFPWPFADVLNALVDHKKPRVLTYHSDIVRQKVLFTLYQPLMNRFLSSMDSIICTSPNYFATSNVLPRFEPKVEVIPIGLTESTYPSPEAERVAAMEAEFGRGFFLFVGVLRYYKGLHILLEAIRNATFNVVIVGSGPTESALKRQAEELGLTNVRFAGFISNEDKVALLKLSLSIVFPSYLRSEAFGVTLLEGAMFGKPLISTEVGSGTSHVNLDGETGFVVPPGSPTALRSAMDTLHADETMAKHMGANARTRFEQHFKGELMAERYSAVYKRLGKPSLAHDHRDLNV